MLSKPITAVLLAYAAIANASPWSTPTWAPTWRTTCTDGTRPTSPATSPLTSSPSGPTGYQGSGPTATIAAGVVIGTTTSLLSATATVNKFLGIPFASPPERFEPPQSAAAFQQPLTATALAPACIQNFNCPPSAQQVTELLFNTPPPAENEDCLYLNVYAPSTPAPADGRAVLFWIFGGGFQFGTASLPLYDGSSFAAYQDVIVVTINYRTNVFGFPASFELPLTERNLGFLDQRLALQWVQDNIAAFGGSPDKVTIFGQSAGAESVDALLTSYPAKSSPPFRGAILESGQISNGPGSIPNTTGSVESWDSLAAGLGCSVNSTSTLACVKAASSDKIKEIMETQKLSWVPIPDNVTYMEYPAALRTAGDIAFIPVMGGTNALDGSTFVLGAENTAAYLEQVALIPPNATQLYEAQYPLGEDQISTTNEQIALIATESVFQCPQGTWANESAAVGIPTWRYYFNASFVNTQHPQVPDLGVYHTSEIPLVFGTYPLENTTTQEYALSHSMQSAWAAFAKNPLGGPGWNPVGTGTGGEVLEGISTFQPGGVLTDGTGAIVPGTWDLAVFGNTADVQSSGVTVVNANTVDARCWLWAKTSVL